MNTESENFAVIRLSGRPPARILKTNWPIIASGSYYQGQFESQANRRSYVAVRQHADGRVIVHGRYTTCWQGERDAYAGVLLGYAPNAETLIATIREVVEDLGYGGDVLANDVIQDLPADDLDDQDGAA
jgi:hypothetical protein